MVIKMKIKIAICGFKGKMGQCIYNYFKNIDTIEILSLIDTKVSKDDEKQYTNYKIYNNLSNEALENVDSMIDFTTPNAVLNNILTALNNNVNCIIGTTGLSDEQIKIIETITKEKNLFTLIAPNFSIGAILMMKFSKIAAQYMQNVEIIEMHHDTKIDAPSGTALSTAKLISNENIKNNNEEKILLDGVRGGKHLNINIHSVRLPGFLARQDVIFGLLGQTLTISHNTISREAFLPGIELAIKKSVQQKGFYFGLEKLMNLTF